MGRLGEGTSQGRMGYDHDGKKKHIYVILERTIQNGNNGRNTATPSPSFLCPHQTK